MFSKIFLLLRFQNVLVLNNYCNKKRRPDLFIQTASSNGLVRTYNFLNLETLAYYTVSGRFCQISSEKRKATAVTYEVILRCVSSSAKNTLIAVRNWFGSGSQRAWSE